VRAIGDLERDRSARPYLRSVRLLAGALGLTDAQHGELNGLARGGGRISAFQLPAATADFTGRAADCDRIVRALTADSGRPGVPVVAISGMPGVGKTALALHVAHQVQDEFPDGQLWADLAGSSARPRSIGEVLGELLRALGVDGSAIPAEDSGRAACFRGQLAGRRVLVVVDDAAAAAHVRLVLPGTAGCALVVTSRDRLEGLEGAHLVALEVMTADDAAGLLTRIVGQHRVAAEPDAAGELVRACGALPLALRIAAAKLATRPSWPVSAMVRKITGAYGLSQLEAGDLSVRASIASSYESLSERSRRAFRLLALLGPSDFAGWVASALLGGPATVPAADVIDELSGRSLLTPLGVDATGEPRYRLHDLLLDYAAEQLESEPAADTSQALERLLAGWLQLAQVADSRLPPEPYFPPPARETRPVVVPEQTAERLTADPVAWFTSERINLLAATGQACEIGRPDLARQLASHQCAYQHLQDRYDDAERIWRTIADHVGQSGDTAGAVYARLRIGASMKQRGLAADAFRLFEWCVETARQLEELEILAFALYWRASCAFDLDDFEQSESAADMGVCVARQAGSRLAELLNLRSLAMAHGMRGAGDRAVADSEAALAIAADLGIAPYKLAASQTMALALTWSGQYERAASLCLRTSELSRELGDVRGDAFAHGMLADAYHGQGRYELAIQSLLQALPPFRAHGVGRYHGLCLMKLGREYEAMGRYPEAIRYLEASLVIFRQLRMPHKVEQVQDALARCGDASGDPLEAWPLPVSEFL
jgi:tetratricopeptide (TPR) repeat protein